MPDRTLLSIYNELYHPANGANYIAIYLTPFLGNDVVVGVPAGTWQVRLHGLDDPRRRASTPGSSATIRPTSATAAHYLALLLHREHRTSTPRRSARSPAASASSRSPISTRRRRRAHITSSQGPTRDGRPKPDIAAPGTDIVAANGFGDPDEPWIAMTGTSMASPYVAGVVGLMLAVEPTLTAAQILGILKATAQPLPGGTYRVGERLRLRGDLAGGLRREASRALMRTELRNPPASRRGPASRQPAAADPSQAAPRAP